MKNTSINKAMNTNRQLDLLRKRAKVEALQEELRQRRLEKKLKETENQKEKERTRLASEAEAEKQKNKILQNVEKCEKPQAPCIKQQYPAHRGLHFHTTETVSIAPIEPICYSKQTQTEDSIKSDPDAYARDFYKITFEEEGDEEDSKPQKDEEEERQIRQLPLLRRTLSRLCDIEEEDEHDGDIMHRLQHKIANWKSRISTNPIKEELKDEEKLAIVTSEGFYTFLCRTAPQMERVLANNKNIFKDYQNYDESQKHDGSSGEKFDLSALQCFFRNEICAGRCITSIDWSKQAAELLLSSYHRNNDNLLDHEGYVMVWNMNSSQCDTPVDTFHWRSPILKAVFTPNHANLIVASTYSGQILVWDDRVPKRTPILHTPLNPEAHTHAINCLKIYGTADSHNILSISTNGKVRVWNLNMLQKPLVGHSLETKSDISTMDWLGNEHSTAIVGSESGHVYKLDLESTEEDIIDGTYRPHFDAITGISGHTNPIAKKELAQLFLSSSIDGTVKLWSLDNGNLLYPFRNEMDYIMDVQWSPNHLSSFASVSEGGLLSLWDMNENLEQPIRSVQVDGQNKNSLNCLSWMPDTGQFIATGDVTGKVQLFKVNEADDTVILNQTAAWHEQYEKFRSVMEEMASMNSDCY